MSKKIVINNTKAHARIALLEDDALTELYIENAENTRTIGNIYLGRVRNLMPGIQAAFVDIGQKQDAFLHFSDVDDNFPALLKFVGETPTVGDFPVQLRTRRRGAQEREDADESEEAEPKSRKSRGRGGRSKGRGGRSKGRSGNPANEKQQNNQAGSEDVHPARYLHNGQKILVQITKEPIANKGSRVCSNISLAGRFLVLVPQADYVAVSRKIWSVRERRRLRALAKSLVPEGFGLIVRTVAEKRDAKTLDIDLSLLLEKWRKIEEKMKQSKKGPAALYEDVSMASSVIRDLFTDDYEKIMIDDQRLHRSIRNYVRAVAPDMADAVTFYKGKKPIFEAVGIADAVAEAFETRVRMPSGGYIFIEHTEAMHVIDVNSGSAGKGQSQEENSLKVNLEAARIVARQLRLRDLGGIIVVDFIDMRQGANRRKVYDELKRAFRKDRAVTKILPMSDFGLMQITRQRLRPSITRDEQLGEDIAKAKEVREKSRIQQVEEEKAALEAALEAAQAEAAQVEANQVEADQVEASVPARQRSPEDLLKSIERLLDRMRKEGEYRSVALRVHPFTAAFLSKGLRLTRWFMKYRIRVRVDADPSFSLMAFEFQHPETGQRLSLSRSSKGASAPQKASTSNQSSARNQASGNGRAVSREQEVAKNS